jgi:hypothetical protein
MQTAPAAPIGALDAARTWVEAFAEGWRAPADADSFADQKDGVAIERVAYMDPTPLIAAIARTPRAWPRFVRQQLSSRRRPR